jgi:dephospho-CoA kinase
MGMRIALSGKMRSGKDTVAKILIDEYCFNKLAYGDGIRKVCEYLFPDEMKGKKNRTLGQKVAMTLRSLDDNVWSNLLLREIDRITPKDVNIIVTDLRFPNEYDSLKNLGFYIVKVIASEDIRVQRIIDAGDQYRTEDLVHTSEEYIDQFHYDYEINNDASVENLKIKTIAMLNCLRILNP